MLSERSQSVCERRDEDRGGDFLNSGEVWKEERNHEQEHRGDREVGFPVSAVRIFRVVQYSRHSEFSNRCHADCQEYGGNQRVRYRPRNDNVAGSDAPEDVARLAVKFQSAKPAERRVYGEARERQKADEPYQ